MSGSSPPKCLKKGDWGAFYLRITSKFHNKIIVNSVSIKIIPDDSIITAISLYKPRVYKKI